MQKLVRCMGSIVVVLIFLDVILVARGQFQPNLNGKLPRQGGLKSNPGPPHGAGPPGQGRGTQNNGERFPFRNNRNPNTNNNRNELSKGVCRDGWIAATMNNAMVCISVNTNSLTWEEAKDSCRDQFGFLLKVEAPVTVQDEDIKSYVRKLGVDSLWTGLHEENDLLVWDELAPHRVRPHKNVLTSQRQWEWNIPDDVDESDVCGELNLGEMETEEEMLVRKRRAPEDPPDNIDMFSFLPNSKEGGRGTLKQRSTLMPKTKVKDPTQRGQDFQNSKGGSIKMKQNKGPMRPSPKPQKDNMSIQQKQNDAQSEISNQNAPLFSFNRENNENTADIFSTVPTQEPPTTPELSGNDQETKQHPSEQAFQRLREQLGIQRSEIGKDPITGENNDNFGDAGTSNNGFQELRRQIATDNLKRQNNAAQNIRNLQESQRRLAMLRKDGNIGNNNNPIEDLQKQAENIGDSNSPNLEEQFKNSFRPTVNPRRQNMGRAEQINFQGTTGYPRGQSLDQFGEMPNVNRMSLEELRRDIGVNLGDNIDSGDAMIARLKKQFLDNSDSKTEGQGPNVHRPGNEVREQSDPPTFIMTTGDPEEMDSPATESTATIRKQLKKKPVPKNSKQDTSGKIKLTRNMKTTLAPEVVQTVISPTIEKKSRNKTSTKVNKNDKKTNNDNTKTTEPASFPSSREADMPTTPYPSDYEDSTEITRDFGPAGTPSVIGIASTSRYSSEFPHLSTTENSDSNENMQIISTLPPIFTKTTESNRASVNVPTSKLPPVTISPANYTEEKENHNIVDDYYYEEEEYQETQKSTQKPTTLPVDTEQETTTTRSLIEDSTILFSTKSDDKNKQKIEEDVSSRKAEILESIVSEIVNDSDSVVQEETEMVGDVFKPHSEDENQKISKITLNDNILAEEMPINDTESVIPKEVINEDEDVSKTKGDKHKLDGKPTELPVEPETDRTTKEVTETLSTDKPTINDIAEATENLGDVLDVTKPAETTLSDTQDSIKSMLDEVKLNLEDKISRKVEEVTIPTIIAKEDFDEVVKDVLIDDRKRPSSDVIDETGAKLKEPAVESVMEKKINKITNDVTEEILDDIAKSHVIAEDDDKLKALKNESDSVEKVTNATIKSEILEEVLGDIELHDNVIDEIDRKSTSSPNISVAEENSIKTLKPSDNEIVEEIMDDRLIISDVIDETDSNVKIVKNDTTSKTNDEDADSVKEASTSKVDTIDEIKSSLEELVGDEGKLNFNNNSVINDDDLKENTTEVVRNTGDEITDDKAVEGSSSPKEAIDDHDEWSKTARNESNDLTVLDNTESKTKINTDISTEHEYDTEGETYIEDGGSPSDYFGDHDHVKTEMDDNKFVSNDFDDIVGVDQDILGIIKDISPLGADLGDYNPSDDKGTEELLEAFTRQNITLFSPREHGLIPGGSSESDSNESNLDDNDNIRYDQNEILINNEMDILEYNREKVKFENMRRDFEKYSREFEKFKQNSEENDSAFAERRKEFMRRERQFHKAKKAFFEIQKRFKTSRLQDVVLINPSDEDLPPWEASSQDLEHQEEDRDLNENDIEELVVPDNVKEHLETQDASSDNTVYSHEKVHHHNPTMKLAECNIRRPSVCYSPPIVVDSSASSCPRGWQGHIFVDKCYKVIISAMSFLAARRRCEMEGGNLANMDSLFHEKLVLMTIRQSKRDGLVVDHQSTFWVQKEAANGLCVALTVNGFLEVPCNTPTEVVCERPANPPGSPATASTNPEKQAAKEVVLSVNKPNNKLKCDLKGKAKELPTVWFKDGQLVNIRLQKRSESLLSMLGVNGHPISPLPEPALAPTTDLEMDTMLRKTLEYSSGQRLDSEMFQGQYWCEVWDVKPFKRRRARSINVRYSDVITFKGNVKIEKLSTDKALLHNMINKEYPTISSVMSDVTTIHDRIVPALRRRFPNIESVKTFGGELNKENPNILNYYTFLKMNKNYTTAEETMAYTLLRKLLRETMRDASFLVRLPKRTPLHVARTIHVRSTIACPMRRIKDTRTGHFATFPRSSTGTNVRSIEICEGKTTGTAKCRGDYSTGAFWTEVSVTKTCRDGTNVMPPKPPGENTPDDSEESQEADDYPGCEGEEEEDGSVFDCMSPEARLKELAEMDVEDSNVESIMEEAADIMEEVQEITAVDVDYIADIMDKTVDVQKITQKVGMNFLKAMDKVMSIDDDEIEKANVKTAATNRILKSFEKCAEQIEMEDGNLRLVQPNVAMEIWKIGQMSKPIIGMAAKHGKIDNIDDIFTNERIYTIYNKSQLYDEVDAAIELPPELVQNTRIEDRDRRLYMMVYRDGRLFRDSTAIDTSRQIDVTFDSNLGRLNSYVISASIGGKKIMGLKNRVKTLFRPLQDITTEKRTCAFWDFTLNSNKGGWSSDGCAYGGQVNGRDLCLCNHLTNFAVLIDFYGQAEPIPERHEFSLSIISLIGLSLSILGLSLTIISYVFFKKLRQGRAQQTLFNLALAMLCSWVVFLTGIRQTHNFVGCTIVAVLLHYFILSSFMWMLMEAFLQYLTFVKVLGTYVTRYTLKTVLVAWGLPLIPIIVVLSVDHTLYRGGDKYCWMALPAFYYAFAAPIGLIILCNMFVFIITVVSICRRPHGLRSNQSKQKIAVTNLQAAITSFVLLGLTWLLGYLAISDARLVFQYAFTILNTLQGFFIFVLFVARKKQVRDQWLILCCCKVPKQEKASRSLSASASIPSTCSGRSSYSGRSERSDSTKTTTSFMNEYESIYTLPYSRNSRESLYFRSESFRH